MLQKGVFAGTICFFAPESLLSKTPVRVTINPFTNPNHTAMKKLFLLSMALLVFAGCNRDDATDGPLPEGRNEACAPHFYGAALPENPAPATRGVADQMKIWNKPFAGNMTVKFLNGMDRYQQFVRETVREWEQAADVHFVFVDATQDAMVRIGFDYVPGMMSSWALTGTDHMQAFKKQTEATVHFANWRRASDALKRSDVLRAFGQVLGLELEFRHPSFHPTWITDASGNIDEAKIREYWENELAEYIGWEELKKVVLDPLEDQAFFIQKTAEYDSLSVMNWPFYEMIAGNLPPVAFDSDYRTELSEQDKRFVAELYGPSSAEVPEPPQSELELVTFDYAADNISFDLIVSEDIAVVWGENDVTPVHRNAMWKTTVQRTFADAGPRSIRIVKMLASGETVPTGSDALREFDFTTAQYARNIDIRNCNNSLTYLRIIGGGAFQSQNFVFADFASLREVYLVQTGESTAKLESCPQLEVFATSRYFANFDKTLPIASGSAPQYEVDSTEHRRDSLLTMDWPMGPEPEPSLTALTITSCPNLRIMSLENTLVETFDFSDFTKLEYVFLSSMAGYIVNGMQTNLVDAVSTLNARPREPGKLILRSVIPDSQLWSTIYLTTENYNRITNLVTARNWSLNWIAHHFSVSPPEI